MKKQQQQHDHNGIWKARDPKDNTQGSTLVKGEGMVAVF